MPAARPIKERLLEKITVVDSCWIFTGAIATSGYGRIGYKSRVLQAHRVSYEVHKGEIPSGLHIDHLCGNRKCVNPDHLEAVTQQENNLRASAKRWQNSDSCLRGHKWTEQTTLWQKGKFRSCRICNNARLRAKRRGMNVDEYFSRLVGGAK